MPKKRETWFTQKHLGILLNYCKATRRAPRVTFTRFHKNYSSYSRRQTTVDLIHKAYKKEVVTGPVLYANVGIEVSLMDNVDDPLQLLQECKKDNETTLAYALQGDWEFIHFKYGASMLQYTESIIPHFFSKLNSHIEDLSFNEKGKLPEDRYPHGWLEEHWNVYRAMRMPRDTTYREVGKEIGLCWKTVKKYYNEILKRCKVLSCFFPLGKGGYSYQMVTFKTDYEIGVLKALRKLNRTSFIYKADGILILVLYLIPRPMDFNISTNKFKELEEKGIIHDLHVCTPRKWYQNF